MTSFFKRILLSIQIGRAFRRVSKLDYEGGFSILKKILAESDFSWSANFLAGVCFAERGYIDGASEYFEKAMVLVSRNKRYSEHDLYHFAHYLYSRYDYKLRNTTITKSLHISNYDKNMVSSRILRYMPIL